MDTEPPASTSTHVRARDRRILLVFVLVALVPIVGAAVRLHQARWVPEGDDAMIARRTMAVFSSHPPITGQPSTAGALFTSDGTSAGIEASHPGPLEYYALAIPYRLSGWSPDGMLAAVALVNGAAATSVVWLAWRRLGSVGAAGGALAVLFVAAHLGSWNLGRPLNAGIAVLPLLAGLVGTWAVLDRDRWAIVPTVVALSFVIQCHLGAAPIAAVALLVALFASARPVWHTAMAARARRTHGEPTPAPPHPGPEPPPRRAEVRRPGGRRRATRAWIASAVGAGLLILCWAPVIGQQFTGDPGNIRRLLDVVRLKVDRAGPGFGLSVVFDQVVRPAWPGSPVLPRISIIGPVSLGWSLLKGLLLAVGFTAAGRSVQWAKRPDLVRLLAVALGALVVPIVVLSRGPDEVRLGPSYQVTSLTAVGGFVLMALVLTASEVVRRHLVLDERRRVALPAAAAAFGAVALAIAVLGGPTYREDGVRTRAIADGIRAKVPTGTYKLQATGTWAYLSTLDAVSVELLRHGYDIRVVRLGGIPDEPVRRDTDVDAPTIMLDSTGLERTDGELLVRRPRLQADPTWARGLLRAVGAPEVRVAVGDLGPDPANNPCWNDIRSIAQGVDETDTPHRRRRLALAILGCPQTQRRQAMERLSWRGVDEFWVDLLGSNMPAPYPHTDLAAYLIDG